MRFSIPVLSLLFPALLSAFLFSACSTNNPIEGEWISTDYQNSLTITDEKVIFDNLTERAYSLEENKLNVSAYGISDTYQFEKKADTLFLTKDTKTQIFIPKSQMPSEKEIVKNTLISEVNMHSDIKIADMSLEKLHWGEVKEDIHLNSKARINDDEWVYVAEVSYKDETYPSSQLLVRLAENKAGVPKPVWTETLESSTRRYAIRSLGIPVKKVKLTPAVGRNFDGLITTDSGVDLPVLLDPSKGVIPKQDENSVSQYFTFRMKQKYGQIVDEINLKENANKTYEGTMRLSDDKAVAITYDERNGMTFIGLDALTEKTLAKHLLEEDLKTALEVKNSEKVGELLKLELETPSEEPLTAFVSVAQGGWYPENNILSLSTATKYRIQKTLGKTDKVLGVLLVPRTGNFYEGQLDYASGATNKIRVEHIGTGFKWQIIK